MAAFQEMLGANLLTKDGLKPTEEVLSGKKAVGIYFSAHWCPPCKGFTPKLAEMYTSAFKAKGMEIVFVSWDRDQSSFDGYYKDMPWVAMPFDLEKEKLNKKFKVSGIPNLVILGPDGSVITKDGREAVMGDPTGAEFPWIPPTKEEKAAKIKALLGDELAKTGGKPLALYFSAHWCPPCRGFTPQLAEWYKNGLKDKMEVLFVSSDRDEDSFKEYHATMPWPALPYGKRDTKEALSKACGVQGIPSMAVINPDGTIVTTDGRSKVANDPKAENFPEGWLPQPCNDVNDDPSPLNEEQCLILMGATADSEKVLKAVAQEYWEAAGKEPDAMPIRFFTGPPGGVVSQLRSLTKVTEDNMLILLDIPEDGAFYTCNAEALTETSLKSFISLVKDGKAERKQLEK
jgi:nucleoredoxin